MCKFCNYSEEKKGFKEAFWTTIIHKEESLGLCTMNFDVDLNIHEDASYIGLTVDVNDDLVFEQAVKIAYCPFCGRKLK